MTAGHTPEWRDASSLRDWIVEHIAGRPYGPREAILEQIDGSARLPRRAARVLTEQEGGAPNERIERAGDDELEVTDAWGATAGACGHGTPAGRWCYLCGALPVRDATGSDEPQRDVPDRARDDGPLGGACPDCGRPGPHHRLRLRPDLVECVHQCGTWQIPGLDPDLVAGIVRLADNRRAWKAAAVGHGCAGLPCGDAPAGDDEPHPVDPEAGETRRQMLGIDGTMGDAQDVPHGYVDEGGAWASCLVCGLARRAVVHAAERRAGDERR